MIESLSIEINGDKIRVTGELDDNQRQYIRQHKPAIIRLSKAVTHYGCDLTDLLSWYQDDMELVATLPSEDLAGLIEDYLKHQNDIYSRKATTGEDK